MFSEGLEREHWQEMSQTGWIKKNYWVLPRKAGHHYGRYILNSKKEKRAEQNIL